MSEHSHEMRHERAAPTTVRCTFCRFSHVGTPGCTSSATGSLVVYVYVCCGGDWVQSMMRSMFVPSASNSHGRGGRFGRSVSGSVKVLT